MESSCPINGESPGVWTGIPSALEVETRDYSGNSPDVPRGRQQHNFDVAGGHSCNETQVSGGGTGSASRRWGPRRGGPQHRFGHPLRCQAGNPALSLVVPTISSANLVRMDEFFMDLARSREAGAGICRRGFMCSYPPQIKRHLPVHQESSPTGVPRAESPSGENANWHPHPAERPQRSRSFAQLSAGSLFIWVLCLQQVASSSPLPTVRNLRRFLAPGILANSLPKI